MQTFLPYPNFKRTAKVLDYRRLGKQRVEGMQIINAIENPDPQGWKNHPIVIMWTPYVTALKHYTNVMIIDAFTFLRFLFGLVFMGILFLFNLSLNLSKSLSLKFISTITLF